MKVLKYLNLALLEFNWQLSTFGKTIFSSEIKKVLEYSFVKTNL